MDIYQSPYTPADLVLMAKEKETLEWDRTCRLLEMIHDTQCPKPMRYNERHPYRKTQLRQKKQVQNVSAREFCNAMKGGASHGNKGRVGNSRGQPRH